MHYANVETCETISQEIICFTEPERTENRFPAVLPALGHFNQKAQSRNQKKKK